MGSFNRDGKRGGGGKNFGKKGRNFFGGKDGFGNHGDGKKAFMHDAVCAKCGKDCQVPFKPSGDRPIFCSNCFEKSGNESGQGRFSKDNFKRPRYEDKQLFSATCAKCGNDCEVPFRPSGGKPVYCSNCFEKKGAEHTMNTGFNNQFKDQFSELNAKLDLILKTLNLEKNTESVPLIETLLKEKKKTKEKTSKKISTKKKK